MNEIIIYWRENEALICKIKELKLNSFHRQKSNRGLKTWLKYIRTWKPEVQEL